MNGDLRRAAHVLGLEDAAPKYVYEEGLFRSLLAAAMYRWWDSRTPSLIAWPTRARAWRRPARDRLQPSTFGLSEPKVGRPFNGPLNRLIATVALEDRDGHGGPGIAMGSRIPANASACRVMTWTRVASGEHALADRARRGHRWRAVRGSPDRKAGGRFPPRHPPGQSNRQRLTRVPLAWRRGSTYGNDGPPRWTRTSNGASYRLGFESSDLPPLNACRATQAVQLPIMSVSMARCP